MSARRQKIRSAFLTLGGILFPLSFYYLSPYLPFMALGEGKISGSLLVFAGMFVLSLVLGRVFCGWICPAGAIQEACFPARDKPVKSGRWIKYLVFGPWLALLLFVWYQSGIMPVPDFFYQTVYGISVSRPEAWFIYLPVVTVLLVLSWTVGKRSFCHHGCWMAPFMIAGNAIRNILPWPSLRIQARKEACTSCKSCNRRCPMSLDVEAQVQAAGQIRHVDCILCGACADGCPDKVLRFGMSPRGKE